VVLRDSVLECASPLALSLANRAYRNTAHSPQIKPGRPLFASFQGRAAEDCRTPGRPASAVRGGEFRALVRHPAWCCATASWSARVLSRSRSRTARTETPRIARRSNRGGRYSFRSKEERQRTAALRGDQRPPCEAANSARWFATLCRVARQRPGVRESSRALAREPRVPKHRASPADQTGAAAIRFVPRKSGRGLPHSRTTSVCRVSAKFPAPIGRYPDQRPRR
jgi:hypothetical protein